MAHATASRNPSTGIVASCLHRREHKVLGCTCSADASCGIPVHGAADIRMMDDRGHWMVFAIRLQLKSSRTSTCCSVTADIPGQRADNWRTCYFCFYFIFCLSYSREVVPLQLPFLSWKTCPLHIRDLRLHITACSVPLPDKFTQVIKNSWNETNN